MCLNWLVKQVWTRKNPKAAGIKTELGNSQRSAFPSPRPAGKVGIREHRRKDGRCSRRRGFRCWGPGNPWKSLLSQGAAVDLRNLATKLAKNGTGTSNSKVAPISMAGFCR